MRDADGLVIGVDLGGTKIHAAAVDRSGQVRGDARAKTHAEDGADAVIARLADLSRAAASAAGARLAEVRAVCVGVPGGTDAATGVVDEAPNLGWKNLPLGAALSQSLGGVPVFLDNDVRVAVVGEHAYGVGRGARTMLGVFVGTGIGGGLILDGALHRGARGAAGEVGHIPVEQGGPRCSCGRRGCIEALASRTAMERQVRERIARGEKSRVLAIMKKEGRATLTSSVIVRALADGDRVMEKVLARAQRRLGRLVGGLCNLLDLEVVVIGGGVAERLGESFVAPIRAAAYRRFLVERRLEDVRILPTQLKDSAAPLGAAFIARQRLDHPAAAS